MSAATLQPGLYFISFGELLPFNPPGQPGEPIDIEGDIPDPKMVLWNLVPLHPVEVPGYRLTTVDNATYLCVCEEGDKASCINLQVVNSHANRMALLRQCFVTTTRDEERAATLVFEGPLNQSSQSYKIKLGEDRFMTLNRSTHRPGRTGTVMAMPETGDDRYQVWSMVWSPPMAK
ncbi:hypothetical protein BKA62DRAFT_672536 [Auriculariales sp. MPI-PUGE-AT-0066]|nr:hypothetical protein BKA62DRAFT_672536 [Auriculariales sp. MPI-PUGE-AT-0066]